MAIKCLLRRIEESSPKNTHKKVIDNTSITEIVYDIEAGGRGGWFLVRVNDQSHLIH